MMDESLPGGRFGRLARFASVGMRSGTALLTSRDGAAAAAQAAEVLGTMRGLAAKLGQMASYVDGIVPDSHRTAYETALKGLRAAAPTSSPEAVRAIVESELGAPIATLFARWQDKPFASASIGQVHRARMPDGRWVAVKVQHPGIERAVESDLLNASVLQKLAGRLTPGDFDTKALYEEIAARFREELDYKLEAAHQKRFTEFHAGTPGIRIPAVVDERCSRRVLTTELLQGMDLDRAADTDEATRRRYAEVLWHFAFRSILVGSMFNADPHPGNYLFRPGGEVVFLDFGCVQRMTERTVTHARATHLAALTGDEEALAHHAARVGDTRGGPYEEGFVEHIRLALSPIRCSPFRVTREFVTELVEDILELKRRSFAKGSRLSQLPEGTVLLNRLQFGFLSVLARLDVEVDYASVERAFFEDDGYVPRTAPSECA